MIEILILLNICHLLADFTPLSTPEMLAAKRFGNPIWPIYKHAMVHGALMMIVLLFFVTPDKALFLACIQILSHYLIDLGKGRLQGRYSAVADNANSLHWVVFGVDQFLHQVIIILMAYLAISFK